MYKGHGRNMYIESGGKKEILVYRISMGLLCDRNAKQNKNERKNIWWKKEKNNLLLHSIVG